MECNIKIPQHIYLALKLPEGDKEKLLLIELAVSLYERGILSFGKARDLAKMSKWDFHEELGKRKVERHYDIECMEEDFSYGYKT
ncbi:UPF0175 family protein [Candidatus Contubernalis alkalaceticus]|nr:UPF0175 family protein [Candidatus Contubernalis alkalaceticus]